MVASYYWYHNYHQVGDFCTLDPCTAVGIYFRLIVFPVVVMAQRNMAHMTNNAPEMARLQVRNLFKPTNQFKTWNDFRKNSLRRVKGTTCTRLTGPRNNCRCALLHLEKLHSTYYHQALMGKQGVNPLKSFIPPLLQIPFFMSMFLGLRGTLL